MSENIRVRRLGERGIPLGLPNRDIGEGALINADNCLVSSDGAVFTAPNLRALSTNPLPTNIRSAIWARLGGRDVVISAGTRTGTHSVYYTVINGADFTGHVPVASTQDILAMDSWEKADGSGCVYYLSANPSPGTLRRLRFDAGSGFLVDERAGVPAPVLTPTQVGASGDWYRYFITFVDAMGNESNPSLHYEERRAADVSATTPLTVPAIPITAIPAGWATSYRVHLYRQGHGTAELRRVTAATIGTVTTAVPLAAYNDTTPDAAQTRVIANFTRGVPPVGATTLRVHSSRLWLAGRSRLWFSRIGEPEAFLLDDLPPALASDAWWVDTSPRAGDDILTLSTSGEGLLIGTTLETMWIHGTDARDMQPDSVLHTGPLNRWSVAEDNEQVYMMGRDRRLYSIISNNYGKPSVSDTGHPLDERLRRRTNASLVGLRLCATDRILTVDVPVDGTQARERLILSSRSGTPVWTRQTAATTFLGDICIKSSRAGDGVVVLNSGGDTISSLYYEYVSIPASIFSTTADVETGWLRPKEGLWQPRRLAIAAEIQNQVSLSITLRAHRRKRDGTIDTRQAVFTPEQTADFNGDILLSDMPSGLTGEWFSIRFQYNGESLRLYGLELDLDLEADGVDVV